MLERCVPVLASEGATFKVAASAERLAELNRGVGGVTQAGKFVTVYPLDDAGAVRLARALDETTRGMRGPRVIGDRALGPASLVHYRYGDFVLRPPDEGETSARGAGAVAPPEDPFVAAGIAPEPTTKLIAGRYLVTGNLHRSVRGAVHLAVDAKRGRTCVLKRAWRDAAVMPDGTDARDRLRDEARVLQSLAPDPHFPEVWDVVEDDLDVFMVMENVEGRSWAEVAHAAHGEGKPPADETVIGWGIELAAALERMHAQGLVHRDLNPVNVIVGPDGGIRLLDFELAQQQGTRKESYGAGTLGYMSPGQAAGEAALVLDDLYGLGALLHLAATGKDPSPGPIDEESVTKAASGTNPNLSRTLARVIATCLSFDQKLLADAAAVRNDLERALRS